MLSAHFSKREIACKCCNRVGSNPSNLSKLLALLEKLRAHIDRPIHLTCAYRCPKHNREVGGVANSLHTQALAADIYVEGMTVDELADAARACGGGGVGRYYDKQFVHVDCGPVGDWSE
jgi:uncharacterized protein YcbK (DUF882 family)